METFKFNTAFYKPNHSFTLEFAEIRLNEEGFNTFRFTGSSFSHGASFYFEDCNGNKIRVSDHVLTGKRAFEEIQIPFLKVKIFESGISLRKKYLENKITKSEYKKICKEKGFIFKP